MPTSRRKIAQPMRRCTPTLPAGFATSHPCSYGSGRWCSVQTRTAADQDRVCSASFREEFFSETGGRTLLSLVLYCTHLTAPAKCFRTCDKGAQPYAARGKAANHVAKVVHP